MKTLRIRRLVGTRAQVALALSLALCAASACAPIAYEHRARAAEHALRAALKVHAAQHARYELTLAELLLAKAREQSGSAHYASARALALRAEQSAKRADMLARARADLHAHARPRAASKRAVPRAGEEALAATGASE